MNSPKEVAQNYIDLGASKAKQPADRMFVLAIFAGMYIALAAIGSVVASATLTSGSMQKFVAGLVFPTGLAMVLIAGSELFTGNCMLFIPVLEKKIKLTDMLRAWIIVWIGNLVGSLLVAVLVTYGGTLDLFSNAVAAASIKTAVAKTSLSFIDAVFRGILCNVLVCLAVWMSFAAKDIGGKVAALYLPIMLFITSGYEHSVANMYYISAGLMAAKNPTYAAAATEAGVNLSKLSWGSMFTVNLLPVTLGNIIGGGILIGIGYWFVYLRGNSKKAK